MNELIRHEACLWACGLGGVFPLIEHYLSEPCHSLPTCMGISIALLLAPCVDKHTHTLLSGSIGVYSSDMEHSGPGVRFLGYPSQFRLHCEMRHCAPCAEGE